jgi:ankyrin repeat protein
MTGFNATRQRLVAEATAAGDTVAVQRLVSEGASVDWAWEFGGDPPLVIAARRGDIAMVDWLLARGAFPLASAGLNPPAFALGIAAERGDTAVLLRILAAAGSFDSGICGEIVCAFARGPHDDTGTVSKILAACATGPQVDRPYLDAAVTAAARNGHSRLVAELLAKGGRPESLRSAAEGGWPDIVRMLAVKGVSLNRQEPETGETPLHAAVRAARNPDATVTTMLTLGCRENGRTRAGETPADLARRLGRLGLADLIGALAPRCGPRWMREARQRGITRYVFHLTKAHGVGFDPHDVESPVLWEGDYVGFGYALTAAQALVDWHRQLQPIPDVCAATAWFVPFIEKLAAGEEFGLDELERAAPSLKIERETNPPA